MKFSTKSLAVALCLTGATGVGLWACSSSNSSGSGSTGGACTQNVDIAFSPMYSAVVDGAPNKAQVPVILTLNGTEVTDTSVTWTTSDSTSTSLDADTNHPGGKLITVTNVPAGAVTISGTYQGCTKASALTVTHFTADQYALGATRYNQGEPGAANSGQLTIPDGGIPPCTSQATIISALKPAACTNCHGTTAIQNLPFKTIEHTPEQTGGFSDADLKGIITQGKLPTGFTIDPNAFPFGQTFWSDLHQWQATDDEVTGLIAYLRSLTPKPQDGSFQLPVGEGGAPAQLPTTSANCDGGGTTGLDASTSTTADAGAADAAAE